MEFVAEFAATYLCTALDCIKMHLTNLWGQGAYADTIWVSIHSAHVFYGGFQMDFETWKLKCLTYYQLIQRSIPSLKHI